MNRSVLIGFVALWLLVGPMARAQVVTDGGFEKGTPNPHWDEHSENFPSPICNVQRCGDFFGKPFEGDWWAWFGGAEERETAYLRQEVTIPKGFEELIFQLDITAASGNGVDSLTVSLDEEEVFKVIESDVDKYHPWTEVSVDIAKFADGDNHLLSFDGMMIGPQRSNFFVDAVQIVGGGKCAGREKMKGPQCKEKRGANKMTVKLLRGVENDTFSVELTGGERKEGTLNRKGKGKAKFKKLPTGEGNATARWGCGAEVVKTYACP